MELTKSLIPTFFIFFIYSCGGGGGGGGGGSSPSTPSPPPAPPPTYTISEGNIYSSSTPGILFIDENLNGVLDANEKTVTPSSNGAFSFTTTNSGEVSCLEDLHIASEDPKSFTYNPSAGKNVGITPFTTILMDLQYTFPINYVDPSRSISDGNCSTWEEFKLNTSKGTIENITLKRVLKFDGATYDMLAADPTDGQTTFDSYASTKAQDLEKFYTSLASVEANVKADLQNLIITNLPGQNISLKTRSELDTSNYRIFLNPDFSKYPNPSTDLSPVAESVDTIAVQAGLDFYMTLEDYSGTYDNSFEVLIDDIKINNAGNILQKSEPCYINFSSICKVDPTFRNVIAYGTPSIRDILHKKTTRGVESFYTVENITDSSSLACNQTDNITLTDTTLTNETRIYRYAEYLGTGSYNIDDLGCYVTSSNRTRWLELRNFYSNGAYSIITLYFTQYSNQPAITNNFPAAIDYDWYDEIDTPPEQIPAAYIDAFLALGTGGWDSFDKILSTESLRNTNVQVDLTFYTAEKRGGLVTAYIGGSSSTLICVPIDGDVVGESVSNSDMANKNYTILDACREQLTQNYQATTEATISNKSPYRGYLDE